MIKALKFINNPNHCRALSVAINYNDDFYKIIDNNNEVKYNKKLKYFYEEKKNNI